MKKVHRLFFGSGPKKKKPTPKANADYCILISYFISAPWTIFGTVRCADNYNVHHTTHNCTFLDNLIGIEYENNTQETRFANYLRQLFPSDVPVMTVAARALGKLLR